MTEAHNLQISHASHELQLLYWKSAYDAAGIIQPTLDTARSRLRRFGGTLRKVGDFGDAVHGQLIVTDPELIDSQLHPVERKLV